MGISIQLMTNPQEHEFNESNDYLILVSDIHFGAYNSFSREGNPCPQNEHIIDFIKLLQNLTEDKERLKVFIILGDFYDLIASTPESIISYPEYQLINQYFNELRINDIPVILTLGNHEIPVNKGYNKDFKNRLNDFIAKFGHRNNIECCQGVILNNSSKNFNLRDVKRICDTTIESFKSYNDIGSLLLHGFQFQKKYIRNRAAKRIWNPLLEERDLIMKEFINLLWNYYLFENRPMKEINEFIDYHFDELRANNHTWYIAKRKVRWYVRLYKAYKSITKHKTNKRYNSRIGKFLQRFINRQFYLFYGHTHICQENHKIGEYLISNTGTWLNTPETSCIKINLNQN